MPEHTLPDALHPQQEDAADELQLRGGLKGRFFADFCLLQSTVDALQNYLVHAATPDVQDMAAPLLEEINSAFSAWNVWRIMRRILWRKASRPGS